MTLVFDFLYPSHSYAESENSKHIPIWMQRVTGGFFKAFGDIVTPSPSMPSKEGEKPAVMILISLNIVVPRYIM